MSRLRFLLIAVMCLAALSALSACSRHGEDQLRQMLDRWFWLGDTVYFQSQMRCTAAVFETRISDVKSALRVETEIRRGLFTLERTGVLALALPGQSPEQVLLTLINSNRSIGSPIMNTALFGRNCMDADTEGAFHAAVSGAQSLLVWVPEEKTLIILDSENERLVLASGVYR